MVSGGPLRLYGGPLGSNFGCGYLQVGLLRSGSEVPSKSLGELRGGRRYHVGSLAVHSAGRGFATSLKSLRGHPPGQKADLDEEGTQNLE